MRGGDVENFAMVFDQKYLKVITFALKLAKYNKMFIVTRLPNVVDYIQRQEPDLSKVDIPRKQQDIRY